MIANAGAALLVIWCLLLVGFIAGRVTAPKPHVRVVCVPPSTAAVTLRDATVLMPAPVGVC